MKIDYKRGYQIPKISPGNKLEDKISDQIIDSKKEIKDQDANEPITIKRHFEVKKDAFRFLVQVKNNLYYFWN